MPQFRPFRRSPFIPLAASLLTLVSLAATGFGQSPKATSAPTYFTYNADALAALKKARRSADAKDFAQAETALDRSLALSPDNFETLKIRCVLLLNKRQYADALALAQKLNKRIPDDVPVRGYIGEAYLELGDYAAAEEAIQWMFRLGPGNAGGYLYGARLREVYGNLSPALEFLTRALDALPNNEVEDRTWVLMDMAHVYEQLGEMASADSLLQKALRLTPDDPASLGVLGQVRIDQKRYDDAVKAFTKRYEIQPLARNLYAVAEALSLAGQTEAAGKAFAEFEQKALKDSTLPENANRELALYYVDHAKRPADALRIAKLEMERRHDVYTLDAYAWSLAATGDYAAANTAMQKALKVGIKDPKVLRHAAAIASHTA